VTGLTPELRAALEKAIVEARDAAEAASRVALDVLGVNNDRTASHLGEEDRRLRVSLRAEARQLGGFERLIEECGYEQWHRMLFARFLAENDLLIHPEHGVALTLEDCEEIAHDRDGTDRWLVASEFASAMLPGIFRSDDPVLQVTLAPEGQQRLEEILAGLPSAVLTSEDGLGWVYQYWQSKKKKEVNASGRKIGGVDIAPVTQLFTENYMVRFLLENTLGAWWASRGAAGSLIEKWEYLRFDEEGKPAAGKFTGWPETIAEVTVMDPCCGSGHFLVVAFEMLRKMRMEAEGLSAAEAGDAVLRDNLFGLELDPRCTQIAAFALALEAWRTGGYRELPIPNIACSGISAKGRLEDWMRLADGDERVERSLEQLHTLFSDASDLGSLIDPLSETDGDLLAAQFDQVAPLLEAALNRERALDPSAAVFGNAAVGALQAARLLAGQFTLVVTNPPFLGRGKQSEKLRRFLETRFSEARHDLSTAFLVRARSLARSEGTIAYVTPENWLKQASYRDLRADVLTNQTLVWTVLLGEEAFREFGNRGPRTALFVANNVRPRSDSASWSINVSSAPGPEQVSISEKLEGLMKQDLLIVAQARHASRPNARIVLEDLAGGELFGAVVDVLQGSSTGDDSRYVRMFWELEDFDQWNFYLTSSAQDPFGGRENVWAWAGEDCALANDPGARIQGFSALGKAGIAVAASRSVKFSRYCGEYYNKALATVVPLDEADLAAVWTFFESGEFERSLRKIDQGVFVTPGTFRDVPIDIAYWRGLSRSRFPEGLPPPRSREPTQWLFSGHPRGVEEPLEVATARLVGYRWPRQRGVTFLDVPALGSDGLESLADEDGIVCIPPVRGERPATERLRELLVAALSEEWSPGREADLLGRVGYAGKSLEQWLRNGFFEQHCQLFNQRPFVWQIWDGRKDGFSALVNYHRLDRANLERLVYTYLGEWIRQQRDATGAGAPGADLRLAAAQGLQQKLELIVEGEGPYDIFVRWKPLEEQPSGWEPDLNDGVRLNIRPFVTGGVLRKNPKIKWGKDRGKDPKSAPWYPVFNDNRINDHHLMLAEKRLAREAAERQAAVS
jgi:hypothetical protein